MSLIRNTLRRYCLTSNTIRYLIEFRCVKRALDHIEKPFDVMLDAGAGSGAMSIKVYKEGGAEKLIGLEPMDGNYSILERNYEKIPDSETIHSGLEKIPMEADSVDGVLTTQVFEHIEDHETAAREVDRVLKIGGHIIFSVPHPPEMFPNDGHVRPGYTEEEVKALWSPLGYEILMIEYFFTLPTLNAMMKAKGMPLEGKFLPVSYADKEADMSNEERKSQQPYGILCLLRKTR